MDYSSWLQHILPRIFFIILIALISPYRYTRIANENNSYITLGYNDLLFLVSLLYASFKNILVFF